MTATGGDQRAPARASGAAREGGPGSGMGAGAQAKTALKRRPRDWRRGQSAPQGTRVRGQGPAPSIAWALWVHCGCRRHMPGGVARMWAGVPTCRWTSQVSTHGGTSRGDLAGGPHGGTSRRPLNARTPALPQLSVRGADAHLTGTES